MSHLDGVGTILTALSPIATAVLGVLMKRADRHKMRKLNELAHEVKPNGGSSMRDAVDRIDRRLAGLTARIEQLEAERACRRWWRA